MRKEVLWRPLRNARLASLFGCVAALSACQGGANGTGGNDDVGGEGGAAPPIDNGPTAESMCNDSDELIPARAIRLTAHQYQRTLQATFAMTLGRDDLPPDGFTNDGLVSFNTYAAGLTVSDGHSIAFRQTAKKVADKLIGDIKRDHGCVSGTPDDGCLRGFVSDYATRAFRRDLTSEETDRFVGFMKDSAGKWGGETAAHLALQAMVLSPAHLYRTEFGKKMDGKTSALSADEIANQLSYMLTDGPPDAALREKARSGALNSAEERRQEAARLLDSEHGREKIEELFFQLLELDHIMSAAKDTQMFPGFSQELRRDMLAESLALVQAAAFGGEGLKALFESRRSTVTGRLAKHYGLAAATGDDQSRQVDLPAERQGILSHGSFLAGTSPPERTSPTERGLFISTHFLCQSIPKAPPGAQDQAAGKIYAPDKNFTEREHWDYALAQGNECTGCHGQFVPLGLGLEQFDAVGRHRSEQFGKKIDPSIDMKDVPAEAAGEHESTPSFVAKLMKTEEGAACFVRHARGFLFGSTPEPEHLTCRNRALAKFLLDNGTDLRATLMELVASSAFVLRKSED